MIGGLGNLEKLVVVLSPEPIETYPDQCLRNLNKDSACRACEQACPLEAITLERYPEVDPGICSGCGVCVSVCPTGALDLARNSALKMVGLMAEMLAASKAKRVAFVCEKNRDRCTADTPVVIFSCLGRLTQPLLLAAASMGATDLWIDTSVCAGCEFKVSVQWIAAEAGRARSLLAGSGIELVISVGPDPPDSFSAEHAEEAIRSDQLSRRGFLTALVREAASGALVFSGGFGEDTEAAGAKHVPQNRVILATALYSLEKQGARGVTEASGLVSCPSIGQGCNVCGDCVTFCPTGALSKVSRDGTTSIVLTISDCVGCGLCEGLCTQDAVTLRPPEGPVKPMTEVELITYTLKVCSDCGLEFGTLDDETVCRFCKKRRSIFGI
jgi:ferredoxin